MATPLRPQQYRLSWPLTPSQVEGLDAMLETLFKRLRAVDLAASANTSGSGDFDGPMVGNVVGRFPFDSVSGEDGEIGLPGTPGVTGAQGPKGTPGADGDPGDDGIGIPGMAGTVGLQGVMGPPGQDGQDGDDVSAYRLPTLRDFLNGTTGSGPIVLADSPALTTSPTAPTQATSDNSTKLATTAYVTTAINAAIAAVNPAVAVQAATTAAGNTSSFTYNNGVSGIGASLTGAVNTPLTVDGYTFTALGQRLLVKNDTQAPSGAFNGVYYVTQVQTAILPLILTRALDYDMPSDINNTGAIPVINGTLNGTTTWVETATVNTVGTDPLSFTEFSFNPANIVTSIIGTADQITASSPTGAVTLSLANRVYATGSYSLSTGTYNVMSNHLILSSTQRYAGAGTSRLRITT